MVAAQVMLFDICDETNKVRYLFLMMWMSLYRSSHPEVFLSKVFWKYAANLQENTHAEVRFQKSCKATLLKSDFGMGVLLYICCIFSERFYQEHLWVAAFPYIICVRSTLITGWRSDYKCVFRSISNGISKPYQTSKMERYAEIVIGF